MSAHIRLAELAAPGGFTGGPFGSNLVSNDYAPNGIPVIRGSNMNEGSGLRGPYVFVSEEKFLRDLSRNTAIAGDLVFTQRGTLGQVVRVDESETRTFVISQSQMRLRLDPRICNSKFVLLACRAPEFKSQIDNRAIRTGVPHINLAILKELKIANVARSVQDEIVEVLGALDDKIAVNEKVAMGALRLGNSFVNKFALRQRALVDLADVTMGSSPKGELLNEDGIGMRFYQGVRDFGTVIPAPRVSTSSPVRTAPTGATLLAVRAPVGAVNLTVEEVCIGRGLASIASKERPATLYFCLRAFQGIWDEHQGGGTVFASVNGRDVREVRLPYPEDSDGNLERLLASLADCAVQAEQESVRLAATRDELLPLLMSGKITVKDAEKTVEGVL